MGDQVKSKRMVESRVFLLNSGTVEDLNLLLSEGWEIKEMCTMGGAYSGVAVLLIKFVG